MTMVPDEIMAQIVDACGAIRDRDDAVEACKAVFVLGMKHAANVADLEDYRRMIPDLSVQTHNPISQVFFRAGLLACREYMARFVEQGGDATTAASIRANWWPALGQDPGAPRLLDFNEIAEQNPEDGWTIKTIDPSIEALPRALQFLRQSDG